MKNLIYIVGIALLFTGCKKHFGDINVDPDQPQVAPPAVLLEGLEGTLGYAYGGDLSRYIGIYTQHLTGVSRQWAVLQNYGIVGEDVNTLWSRNLYAGVLMEVKQMKEGAVAEKLTHYEGIAQVLEAYTLLIIADNWNSAPYTDAFQGFDQLQPAYDSQDELYSTIFQLLTAAKTNLATVDGGLFLPGAEDLIFGGNVSSWIGFANFVEARAYLHRGKQDASNYQKALDAINAGALIADCGYPFNGVSSPNPMFQFNEQRGDCEIGGKIQELVTTLNDPRRFLYDNTFDTGHPMFASNQMVFFGTQTEQKFIEAECTFQVSGAAAAHPLYLEAINLSFGMLGYADSAAAYIAQPEIDPGAGALTLENIMTQKYIALFMDPEVFNDWRRTGFPTLTPTIGASVPRRLPYPQHELNLNSNTPNATIYNSVDWDI